MLLKVQPDAACDLHAEGINDAAHTLRLYANGDGYIRVHVGAGKQEEQDMRVQLDCTSAGKFTTYPLHLHAGTSPTDNMPAPQAIMPTPTGSRVLPALTEEGTSQLSDEELRRLGYPTRPDASESPERYAKWLGRVSRPLTLVPAHSVSRTDVSHHTRAIEAGTEKGPNWSGYEARGPKRS